MDAGKGRSCCTTGNACRLADLCRACTTGEIHRELPGLHYTRNSCHDNAYRGVIRGALLMFDKILGFLNKFLALPTPREDILFGKILFITSRGLVQSTIIFIIAVLIGATILSPAQYGMTYLILFLFGVLISSVATTIALHLGDHDSYAAVNTMISMPLFFTSTALMPYEVMPEWLQVIAHLNPLSWAIDAIREVAVGIIPWVSMGVITLLAIIVIGICMRVFRKVTV